MEKMMLGTERASKLHLNIYTFIAFYLNIDMLEDLVKSIYILVMRKDAPYFINIFLMIFGLGAFLYVVITHRIISFQVIFLIFVSAGLYFVSWVLNKEITPIIRTAIVRGILYVFIPVYLFTYVKDVDKLFDALIPYIFVGIIYVVIQIPIKGSTLVSETHRMDVTYNSIIALLLALGIVLFDCRTGRKKLNKFLYFLIFFLIFGINFIIGGRAVILCTAIGFVIWVYYLDVEKKMLFVFLLVVSAGLLLWEYDNILKILVRLFPQSRTIVRISNNNLINTSNSVRILSYKYILREFVAHPFVIRGFLSDRVALFHYISKYYEVETMYGSYAHNIVLEMLYQFGIVSIPIILFLVLKLIQSMIIVKNQTDGRIKVLGMMIYAYCVGQLSVSSSYLIAKSFGMLVGFIFLTKKISGRKYEYFSY